MSRFGSVSALTVGAVLACAAFAVTMGAAFAGMDPATAAQLSSICGATAALLSATCAVRSVASIWRGPRILSFGRDDAVLCPPDTAHAIRNAAQIRGTMGGAGWVYRWRRLLPAIGWAAAAVLALEALGSMHAIAASWPLLAIVPGGLAAMLLPARPFYYREVNGGGVLVSPQGAPARLGVATGAVGTERGLLRYG